MNLTQLRGLIAVAEAGSFTAAAAASGITQSGLSQALAALEDSLGTKLFVRQRHGVRLTAFGERALDHARATIAQLEALRRDAREAAGEERGSLRIAAFPSVFATILPPLLSRFGLLYPGINVVALETDDREIEVWLRSRAIDLGIVLNPAPDRDAIVVGRDAWVGILPTAHPLSRRSTSSIAALAAEPFVLATGGCHHHARSLAEAAGVTLADVRLEVRDWGSAIALVREGLGVSIVPESTLPERRRGLRAMRLDPPVFRQFGLLKADGRAASRPVDEFIALARRLPAFEPAVAVRRGRTAPGP